MSSTPANHRPGGRRSEWLLQQHWHGASPTTVMTHLAVQEHQNGKVVEWMEKVTDEQYLGAPSR